MITLHVCDTDSPGRLWLCLASARICHTAAPNLSGLQDCCMSPQFSVDAEDVRFTIKWLRVPHQLRPLPTGLMAAPHEEVAEVDGGQQGLEEIPVTPSVPCPSRSCNHRRWGGKKIAAKCNKGARQKFGGLALEEVKEAWEWACAATQGRAWEERMEVISKHLHKKANRGKTRRKLFRGQESMSCTDKPTWPLPAGW